MNTVNSEFERQKRRKRAVKKGVMVLKYAALAVASFIVLMPILWFMTSSFRSNNEVFANINRFPSGRCSSELTPWRTTGRYL